MIIFLLFAFFIILEKTLKVIFMTNDIKRVGILTGGGDSFKISLYEP